VTEIFVIVPTYNEKENLPLLAEMLLALPLDLSVIVVDDASPDGTGELADALARQQAGRFSVIHRTGKLGLGTAYLAGFKHALAQGAARVVTMDADFSHHPRYIPPLCRPAGSAMTS
jgi:dolichol-phosphate mannosyltransferase